MNELPNKRYYSIGEVSRYCNVAPYTLRYWEKKIKDINPIRFCSKRRYYTRVMIDKILCLRDLIVVRKLTIDGAAQVMKLDMPGVSPLQSLVGQILDIIEE